MARPTGLEPVTPSLEGLCSIRLSYGRHAAEQSVKQSITPVFARVQYIGICASYQQPRRAPISLLSRGGLRKTADLLDSHREFTPSKTHVGTARVQYGFRARKGVRVRVHARGECCVLASRMARRGFPATLTRRGIRRDTPGRRMSPSPCSRRPGALVLHMPD